MSKIFVYKKRLRMINVEKYTNIWDLWNRLVFKDEKDLYGQSNWYNMSLDPF